MDQLDQKVPLVDKDLLALRDPRGCLERLYDHQ